MTPVYVTPGIFGQPNSLRDTVPVNSSGCDIATAVCLPCRGTSLFGGFTPFVTQSSSAIRNARCARYGLTGFKNCWHVDMLVTSPTPCDKPDSRQKRASSGSFKSLPRVSVCSSEPAFTQYSFPV